MTALPPFRYHPDPLTTGEIEPSQAACLSCGQRRGYVYTGPVYAVEELDEELCPWCVADGSAAARFDAHFTDTINVPADVPVSVLEEVTTRTPGYKGWQQEYWLFHCGDAAAYLGRVGYDELQAHPEAVKMLLHENDEFGWSPEQSERYVRRLDADGDATGICSGACTAGHTWRTPTCPEPGTVSRGSPEDHPWNGLGRTATVGGDRGGPDGIC